MEVDEVPAQADGDYKRRETGRELRISVAALSFTVRRRITGFHWTRIERVCEVVQK